VVYTSHLMTGSLIPLATQGTARHAVWIVEDSALEAEVAKRVLERIYDVVVFDEASTMLEMLASTPIAPSAIVLDWQMPGLPGLEACKFVRTTRNQNALPILMLTGLSERADLVEAISAGANDYLTKPYDGLELLARVAAVVRTKQLHDRLLATEASEREARTEAQAANRAKDQFLAMASHELRTPLNAILGWAQLMRSGQLSPSDFSRAIETIERNAKSQVQLIEDILDGSRIMAGKQRLEIAPFNFSGVVRAAVDSVKPALEARNITLKLDLEDDAAAPVDGDAQRIQQVVGNLLSNAVKFTQKDGHIEVHTERVNGSIRLTVRDDGMGIAPEFLPQVFERFRQAEGAPSRRHGGLGLGLSLVRHFVEAHDGTVTVASEGLGRGATFVVTLPVASLMREPEAPKRISRPEGDVSRLVGLKVLVVDDEADGRELVATALRLHGAAVTTSDSAEGALALIDELRPAVLVSDIRMPKTDGFEFIRRLRARTIGNAGERLPALALTANARDEDRDHALAAGFDMYLAKPVNAAELAAAVAELSTRPSGGQSSGGTTP
jgi:signal transduction histidine kinase